MLKNSPSENSFHRGGSFFSTATSEISDRRSHNHWKDRPFYDFIENGGDILATFDEILEGDDDCLSIVSASQ